MSEIKPTLFKGKEHILSGLKNDVYMGTSYLHELFGLLLEIDGKRYAMFEDPDDGLRSYSRLFDLDDEETPWFMDPYVIKDLMEMKLVYVPDEKVNIEFVHYADNGRYNAGTSKYVFSNPETNEIILEVGTEDEEDYYPVAIFKWHPENLKCNKNVRNQ